MAGDLHCHTKLSDGSLGIEALIKLARELGIGTIAITDHDTWAGNSRAVLMGERHGVKVIPGVELSTIDPKTGKKAHLIAYLCEIPNRLEGICSRISHSRKIAGQVMVARAMKRFPLTPEHVMKCAAGSTSLYKQHIMRALMELGYATSIYGELFQELFCKDSPHNILSEVKYPDIRMVLEEIHHAKGIAVLAHPGYYDNFDIIEELIELGLDGLEVWHPRNTEEDSQRLEHITNRHKLLKTGGSDFHGMYNSRLMPLGSVTVSDDLVEELLTYKDARK